ncbi:hypothetical protein LC048_13765 [Mesobacillus subterraneus]|uniref:hypothetical protein n=1 Tax=Mesobacillus subterraneus TaxID=285983 RepID=UPI001CFE561A|nr:hypothetical protein [Mesobacillus subterraneus]WLR53590.1 hypothetical protein LC048_13765 [Mesobacillus subterraneus]
MKCICGRDLEEEVKGIVTKYKDKSIIINDVPYFICHFGHIRMARTTRKSVKTLLEKAYEEGNTEIDFTA